MRKKILYITYAAAIAAIYVVLTLIANALGLANYAIQIRFSEALTILPFFTSAAIPGLFIGCILANILTGALPFDVVFGSIATLIGAIGTYYLCGKAQNSSQSSVIKKFLAPLPPIISNTLIIPFILAYVYKLEGSIPYFMITVGAGEIISCGILGLILLDTLKRRRSQLFPPE
jgi:uncharacterized membrane protein